MKSKEKSHFPSMKFESYFIVLKMTLSLSDSSTAQFKEQSPPTSNLEVPVI